MKTDIHPKYQICQVTCACGNSFATRSVRAELKLEICSACHPAFTGVQKFVDSEGRIDKFLKKFDQAKVHKESVAKKKEVAKKIAAKQARLATAKKAATQTAAPGKKPKVLTNRPADAALKPKK